MSDVLSATDKWQQKLRLQMRPILKHIEQRQRNQKHKDYRGQEHFWYTVWNCELAKLCDGTTTLVPCPQRRILGVVRKEDETEVDRWLTPDFTLKRVAESRRKDLSSTMPLRRSARKPMASSASQAQNQAREQSDPNPGPGHTGAPVLQKSVAFAEVKCPPKNQTVEQIQTALLEAHDQLTAQVQLFFNKPKERHKMVKEVVGIFAAGQYWGWKVFKPDNFGTSSKPFSMNEDATYTPPDEQKGPERREVLVNYILDTPESDAAMQDMLAAIFNLHGSRRMFGDKR